MTTTNTKTTAKVYRYGLLDPRPEDLDVLDTQIRAAHRYYNTLIAIERKRREERNQLTAPVGNLPQAEAHLNACVADVEHLTEEIKAWRVENRKQRAPKDKRENLKALKEKVKVARQARNALREKIQQDPVIQEGFVKIDARADTAQKQARANCTCFWGTYLKVEAAVKAASGTANPQFKRWRRTNPATLSVQLQRGVSVDRVFGDDTRLHIKEAPDAPAGKARHVVYIRVGSNGRAPVWAAWPLIYHRPLPENAQIKWAQVKRDPRAGRDHWSLHLTVDVPTAPRKASGQSVAVDVGWRKVEGGMRVGYWQDDVGHTSPIMLDMPPDPNALKPRPTIMEQFRKVEDLSSIRDKRMNALIADLRVWLKGRKVPTWLAEARKTLHAWRSQARLAGLHHKWKTDRFPSDEEGYGMLKAWQIKDRHLWAWEANLRKKTQRRRSAWYKIVAADLAERYGTLVLNDFDLRKTQQHAALESGKHEVELVRWQQTKACCSDLRQALKLAFWSRGGHVIEVPAAMVTRRCARCGYDEPWTRPAELIHTCANPDVPKHTFDRDQNSTTNMLRASKDGTVLRPIKRKSVWAKRHKANKAADENK